MGGLGEGRKTSRVEEEIVVVNISLLQGSHWFFGEQRGAIGVEMLLHTQESMTSIGLDVSNSIL
jgi:hypothetical protein